MYGLFWLSVCVCVRLSLCVVLSPLCRFLCVRTFCVHTVYTNMCCCVSVFVIIFMELFSLTASQHTLNTSGVSNRKTRMQLIMQSRTDQQSVYKTCCTADQGNRYHMGL